MNNPAIEFIFGLDQVQHIAQQLVVLLEPYHIIMLEGELGAGKTTLMKALLHAYGVDELVTSPTFTYLISYNVSGNFSLYHFDLYRIASVEHFLEAGFDEYLNDKKSKVFIEWPGIIEPLLASYMKRCAIVLDYYSADERKLSFLIR